MKILFIWVTLISWSLRKQLLKLLGLNIFFLFKCLDLWFFFYFSYFLMQNWSWSLAQQPHRTWHVLFILCRCCPQKPLHSACCPVTFPQWWGHHSQSVRLLHVPFVSPDVSRETPFHPLLTSTFVLGAVGAILELSIIFKACKWRTFHLTGSSISKALFQQLEKSPQYYRALSSWLEWGRFVY